MTTTDHRPAWCLDHLLDRGRTALRITANSVTLRVLAAIGDPVAQLLAAGEADDIYDIHERIRARGPLTPSRTGLLAVTSHSLCREILRDPRFGVRQLDGQLVGSEEMPQSTDGPLGNSFLELDPPDHTRLRRLAAPAFRPAVLRGFADRLEALAHELLDRVDGREQFDLIDDFAAPFPITVISDLLGIPDVDTARFAEIGMLIGQSLDGVRSLRQADRLRTANDELATLFTRLADDRRTDPGDDVISLLTTAQADGRLTGPDLVATCGLLLIAGFETTVNLIGNGVDALLADRTGWDRVAADPALAEAAVEETLRYDPPVQITLRAAHESVELAESILPADTAVLLDLAAANRDPDVYPHPERFDLDRPRDIEHLAFSNGIHYCLGAPLARLEGAIAYRVLTQRLPNLRPLPGARHRGGSTIRGYRTYPVTAHPRHGHAPDLPNHATGTMDR
ncbi:MAG: cytochrome P450 [Pseudonocardiaceae bacterium]